MTSRRALSFSDYSSAARRRKLILILPMFILAGSTAVALRALPQLYESTARLRLTSVKTDTAPDLSVHIREFRERLTGSETLARFVAEENPPADSSESSVSLMRTRVFVETDSAFEAQPGAFTVSYRATDPQTAQKITADLASRLVTIDSKESIVATSEVEVLRKRAAEISLQLRQLETNAPWLSDSRSDLSGTASSPSRIAQPSLEAMRDKQMTIDGLKDQQYKIQQQLSDVEKRITLQRQIVEQQKKGSGLRDNPTYAVLIAKRTELQGQRDTLINRQELTDKHPRVLAITDQIAAINRQIEELRQQDTAYVSQTPEARELASIESERNRLKIDLEVTGRELARRSTSSAVPVAAIEPPPVRRSGTSSKLTQQYLSLKRNHQDATNELQNAESRLTRENGASLAQVSVLVPADLPSRPILPSRTLLISIAAAMGLFLGLALAVCAESRRFNSLQNARDVEYYTRLPLLGSIPATATAGEGRRARRQAALRFAFATATSVVATLALSKIFVIADIFALIIRK